MNTRLLHRHPSIGRNIFGVAIAGIIYSTSSYPVWSQDSSLPSTSAASDPLPATAEAQLVDPSITLRGSVWRTKAGIAFLKTPIGMLTLSSKTTLKDLRASHEVLFWVRGQNSVVEIRKRSDGSLVHRYLTGPMTIGIESPKTLRWWTPGGEEITHFGTQEERLGQSHEGDLLTVEADESHTVIGVHDLQYDLQISQSPPSGSDAQLYLSGTVSKVKSNFVFFRTPIGLVMVNAKIGVPRVKVGQPMTLQIDNQHVTVDLTPFAAKTAPNNSAPVPSPTPIPSSQ